MKNFIGSVEAGLLKKFTDSVVARSKKNHGFSGRNIDKKDQWKNHSFSGNGTNEKNHWLIGSRIDEKFIDSVVARLMKNHGFSGRKIDEKNYRIGGGGLYNSVDARLMKKIIDSVEAGSMKKFIDLVEVVKKIVDSVKAGLMKKIIVVSVSGIEEKNHRISGRGVDEKIIDLVEGGLMMKCMQGAGGVGLWVWARGNLGKGQSSNTTSISEKHYLHQRKIYLIRVPCIN